MLASRNSEEFSRSAAQSEEVVAPGRLPRWGVALFDNPRDMSSGWACMSGTEPFYFTSVADLTSDALWVTSLDYSEYVARAQKLHHLRRVDFLRTSLSRIASDLGMRIDGEYARVGSLAMANVLGNAMHIAISMYGWEDPLGELREDTLADDIKRTVVQAPKPQRHLRAPLLSAHQASSNPSWANNYEPDSTTVTLRYNRLDYAQRLLEASVPDEGWTLVTAEHAGSLSLDQLLDPARPTLVEASVEFGGSDPDIATLCAFGMQFGRRNGVRKWIAQPELLWLSRHARVQVTGALISRSARPLPDAAKLPKALTADPTFSLSIAAGLVAESHVHALTSQTYQRISKQHEASAWAVWIKAMDRSLSFALALKAFQAGFLPLGYGSGSVTVRCQRQRLPELLAFADANDIFHPTFQPLFEEHGLVV